MSVRAGATAARSERGSATVLVVGATMFLLSLLLALLVLGSALIAGGRASTAADLASLAAAGRLAAGGTPGQACAVAVTVAGRNSAKLTDCQAVHPGVSGGRVAVTVTVEVTVPVPGLGPAQARARAGLVAPALGGG